MDWPKAIGTALIVGVIGPLFWLLVDYLANKAKGLFIRAREQAQRRRAERGLL